jgi:hypothetical protein
LAGAVLLSTSASFAQMGQQQQPAGRHGIMSAPQSGQQSGMNAPIQQVNPL